MKKEFLNFL